VCLLLSLSLTACSKAGKNQVSAPRKPVHPTPALAAETQADSVDLADSAAPASATAAAPASYVPRTPLPPEPVIYSLDEMDDPLVEIIEIDPTIVIDVRYATANNFMGRP